MDSTHQQVDVTPCSTKQEETEAFKVRALLYSSREGASQSRQSGEGRTDTLKWVAALLLNGDKQL